MWRHCNDTLLSEQKGWHSVDDVFHYRYVREWVGTMVCSHILEVDNTSGEERFFLPDHRVSELRVNSDAMQCNWMITYLAKTIDKMVTCFPEEGPKGAYKLPKVLSQWITLGDDTWALWRLIKPANWLFVLRLIEVNNKVVPSKLCTADRLAGTKGK